MDNIIAGAVMRTPHADAAASHRFAAGHMVRLSRAIPLRNAAAGNYEVLAQLPERDGDLQYRIKSDREPYQRIVKEGELEQAIAQSMPEQQRFEAVGGELMEVAPDRLNGIIKADYARWIDHP